MYLNIHQFNPSVWLYVHLSTPPPTLVHSVPYFLYVKLFHCSVDQNTRLIFSLEIFLDSNEEMIKVGDHMI